MRISYAVPLTGALLAILSGCGSSEPVTREVAATPQGPFGEELLSKPLAGVTDCPSGYSFGGSPDYFGGGGKSTAQAAIDTLSSQVAQEQEAALEPRIVARSATEPIVECSADSRVVARGSVIAVDDYWQIEGLSQCSLRPAPAK